MSESVQVIRPFVERRPYGRQRVAFPTRREWLRHVALFAGTVVTTTFAGALLVGQSAGGFHVAEPTSFLGYFYYIPLLYISEIAGVVHAMVTSSGVFFQGLAFSVSLLAILTAHESGHYVACRLYRVDATLPFFIPAPPLIFAGTFGAFIKIRSPIPSRRALFDIGVAGPIAGFVIAIPVLFLGLLTAHAISPDPVNGAAGSIYLQDSLLAQFAARILKIDLSVTAPNPFYLASWIGLLVTSLNLMPVGQLDGGHAVYAIFGLRAHKWIGRTAFVAMIILSLTGWFLHGSPTGFVYILLLAVVLRMPHPQPENESPLDPRRKLIALGTLLIFVVSFLPFPITVK